MKQITNEARHEMRFRGRDGECEAGACAGIESDGGNAITGPGTPKASGFGGLGLAGIVGKEESDGEKAALPGEGKSGSISGERGVEARGAAGNNVGAADMVEMRTLGGDAKDDEKWDTIKARRIEVNDQKEAINDRRIKYIHRLNDGTLINVSAREKERYRGK